MARTFRAAISARTDWITKMQSLGTYLSVDLRSWVLGTIKKVQSGADWNHAWQNTYRELGGTSKENGKKGCPMNGTKTLYLIGRIQKSNMPYIRPRLQDVWDKSSANGVYALLALEHLSKNPKVALKNLWPKIQESVRNELKEKPARSNQGGPTVAYKLWHLGLIIHP